MTEEVALLPGRLLPGHFTLTGINSGGMLSVALSFPQVCPAVSAVSGLPALRSPDFPPGSLPAAADAVSNI